MKIKIKKEFAEAVGVKRLEEFGASEVGWSHCEERLVDLSLLSPKKLDALEGLLKRHPKLPNVFAALYDLSVWRRALSDPSQKARNAEQAASLLKLYLQKVDGHRVYKKRGDHWLAHYVSCVTYHPKHVSRDGVTPAYVKVDLVCEVLGGQDNGKITIWESDSRKAPATLLSDAGYHAETPELRASYLEEAAKFMTLQPQVGLQLDARGTGTDDLDGNGRDAGRWYWRQANVYPLGSDAPSRVVVDVFREEAKDRDEDDRKVHIDSRFWSHKRVEREDDDVDAELEGGDAAEGDDAVPEVPVHPYLAVFDLQRHLRLRVHVRDVEVHEYDRALSDKLVLAPELKGLVSLLIEHREGGFRDVVSGKGGGAVVLLAGPPGTGKTLTAEVYAESEGRALYSVQCSQLGTKPDDLEESLLKCFSRARRWNAVMLLDEADVYVHARGQSLQQNAIVGVFLRVLEYQQAVLFLTTNKPEDVDDAVASRCVAKLKYRAPSPDEQARIWRILAAASGGAATVTPEDVEYVKQFKPTE